MPRSSMPLYVGDVSLLARSLRRQLQDSENIPSHVEMLNLLTKAGGFRNFQHFKAQHDAREGLETPRPVPAEINFKRVKRILRLFDDTGSLTHWPKKYSEQVICLWVLWSRIAARTTYSEAEIGDLLGNHHRFEDHALLRRLLVDHNLMTRTPDGRQYQRVELPPPPEAVEAIKRIRQ